VPCKEAPGVRQERDVRALVVADDEDDVQPLGASTSCGNTGPTARHRLAQRRQRQRDGEGAGQPR
jgi:hypothetical protein